MRFIFNESLETQTEMYEGWDQEDIELFESIDWSTCEDRDYDAGYAYLDSVMLFGGEEPQRVETEFHKFFKNNPYKKPYYMPVEAHPFITKDEYSGPIGCGDTHRDYDVYNRYDLIKQMPKI